jgi:glycosyltransferase involved in cell wall biosynthesis
MKFAILIDQLRYVGGPFKIAVEEVKSLSKLGEDATLVVLKRTDSTAFPESLHGIRTIYLSDSLPRILRFSFSFPVFRFFSLFHLSYAIIFRFLPLRERFDAIIAHGTYTCFSAIAIAKNRTTPVIAYVWDPITYILRTVYFKANDRGPARQFALSIGAFLDKWICRNSSKVLVGSGRHKATLDRLIGDPEKVTVLVPGVQVRDHSEAQRGDFAILATAWRQGKDPEYVLDLASRVHKARFLMAGIWLDGSLRSSFIKRIAELNLQDRVEITDAISEEKLLELYSRALVFLQIHADVGFGLPALEAAAQGCTFVIPEGQGVCEVLSGSGEGYFVQEKRTDSIVAILNSIFDNPMSAIRMGELARERATGFSWARHAERLRELSTNSSIESRQGCPLSIVHRDVL